MMLKRLSIVLMLAALSGPAAAAGNPVAGEKKAQTCVSCHGPRGAEPIQPSYPVLAGQYADYLYQALKAYKNGDRQGGNAAQMVGFVTGLTEQDMKDIAAYFAAQDGLKKLKVD